MRKPAVASLECRARGMRRPISATTRDPLTPEAVVPTAWLLSVASGSVGPAAGVDASAGGAGACDGRERAHAARPTQRSALATREQTPAHACAGKEGRQPEPERRPRGQARPLANANRATSSGRPAFVYARAPVVDGTCVLPYVVSSRASGRRGDAVAVFARTTTKRAGGVGTPSTTARAETTS
jgi:hypothetical protein